MNDIDVIKQVAILINTEFYSYQSEYFEITNRAKKRFENREWKESLQDAVERLNLYEKVLERISRSIKKLLGKKSYNRSVWIKTKNEYSILISGKSTEDIAETFFNSVTRKILATVGIDRDVEFFYLAPRPQLKMLSPKYLKVYHKENDTRNITRKIINDLAFEERFENLDRDIELVSNELNRQLTPLLEDSQNYRIEIIKPCFFRNKAAYIVGRIVIQSHYIPLVLPLYNDEKGIYIDTVLTKEIDVSKIFSFAFSYFFVDVNTPVELVEFLRTILPNKPVSDLFNSIGNYKHGKTEFYRNLHRYIHVSEEKYIIAPGEEGAVMIAFTLPDFNYVFKVIKDYPCFLRSNNITNKNTNKSQVMDRYKFVINRDRAGRLVDTQEFENIRFKVKRYSDDLLYELKAAARESVRIRNDYVIVNHMYIQRKVTPLPIFFNEVDNSELIYQVVIDFGYFLKDIAATGLFPSDLFNTWNYGVTSKNRVVLYDYDDVLPLETINFHNKPIPRNDYEELLPEEDWIVAEPTDFFMDEIHNFLGVPNQLMKVFKSIHKDLFTIEFWNDLKGRVLKGEVFDLIPYDRAMRFQRHSREA
jgi:isocitrate dehydrogenase kinase/phosphatase